MGAGLSLIQSMAVTAGQKILLADLVALADQANSLSTAAFDLSAFYDVSPMYWANGLTYDNGTGSAKYGYKQYGNVVIDTPGTGYVVGELINPSLVTSYEITMVNGAGGVTGIRPVNQIAISPTFTLASPVTVTGGSGTGCKLAFTLYQFGPTAPYDFPDYDLNTVWWWNFKLVSGGLGYTVGNVLTPTDLTGSGTALTVSTVDGAGAILTFAITANNVPTGLPANTTAMPVTGGSGTGATFLGLPTMSQSPAWATELARLRSSIAALVTPNTSPSSITPFSHNELAVSGPPNTGWPIAAPSSSYGTQWFYYEETAGTESITISCPITLRPAEFSTVLYSVSGVQKMIASVSKSYFQIGGTVGGLVQADFVVRAMVFGTVGAATSLIDVVVDFPGASISKFTMPSGGGADADVVVLIRTNATFDPGRYSFTVTVTQDAATQIIFGGDMTGGSVYILDVQAYNSVRNTTPYFLGGTQPKMTATFNASTLANGIDGTKNIRVIQLAADPVGNPWGWQTISRFVTNTAVSGGAYTIGGTGGHSFDPTNAQALFKNPAIDDYLPPRVPQFTTAGNYVGYVQSSISSARYTFVNFHRRDTNLTIQEDLDIALWLGSASSGFGGAGNPPHWTDTPTGSQVTDETPFYYGGAITLQGVLGQDPPPYLGVGPWGESCYVGIAPYGWNNYPWPQPTFSGEYIYPATWTLTTTVAGLWAGITPMVSSLNPATNAQMPWNILQRRAGSGSGGLSIDFNPMLLGGGGASYSGGTGGSSYTSQRLSNSYNNAAIVEAQNEPPSWAANRWFTVGFVILDSNGNFQQVTVAGCSASTHPTWATTVGATCTDGTGLDPAGFTQPIITWLCLRVNTSARGIVPAAHRLPNPASSERGLPRYPFYWDSETVAKLKPPISGTALTIWGNYAQWTNIPSGGNPYGGWQYGNQAKGWFIYSVSISRLKFVVRTQPGAEQGSAGGPGWSAGDTSKSAGGMSTTGEIAVTIGCMRSGAFVAFGTYASGQTIQVLWPIFTTDSLVYQAAERVDLQAIAIANGGAGVAYGASVTFPLAAAYVTDTDKLLTLIAGN